MRSAFWLLSLVALSACCLTGCGGKVVFQTGESEGGAGGQGAGGDVPGTECVAGACGEPCTKCVGNECYGGACSDNGFCLPPETPPSCVDG